MGVHPFNRACQIDVETGEGLIAVRLDGMFELSQARRAWAQATGLCRAGVIGNVLLDLRGRVYPFSPEEAHPIFGAIPFLVVGKAVAVLLRRGNLAYAPAMRAVGEETWNRVEIFHCELAARRWLDQARSAPVDEI